MNKRLNVQLPIAWRTSKTMRLGPVVVVLGCLISIVNAQFVDPYWLDITSKATVSQLLTFPGFAALAAWDAHRWRSSSALSWMARSRLQVLISSVLPGACGCMVAVFLSASVISLGRFPTTGWLGALSVLGPFTVHSVAFVSIGFASGLILGRLPGTGLSLVGIWLWLAFPPAIMPFWIRNVTPNQGLSCCSLEYYLDWKAITAPLVVSLALIIGSALFFFIRAALAATSAIALVLAAILLAKVLVGGFGADAVTPRINGIVCISASPELTLCGWQEHERELAMAAPEAAAAYDKLAELGLRPQPRLTESTTHGKDAATITLRDASGGSVRANVALSLLEGTPPGCVNDLPGPWPAGEAYSPVIAWLLATVGVPDAGAIGDDEGRKIYRRLQQLPVPEQGRWVSNSLIALRSCTIPTPSFTSPPR